MNQDTNKKIRGHCEMSGGGCENDHCMHPDICSVPFFDDGAIDSFGLDAGPAGMGKVVEKFRDRQ
jgi:hypothetical protein